MLISDLVARLEAIREEHGDLPVESFAYGDIDHHAVQPPQVHREHGGRTFVLVEGG